MSSRMERLAGSSKSMRRRATVTISAPEAARAATISALERYFPVPSKRRLVKSRPAMVSGVMGMGDG